MTPREIVQLAESRGLGALAITDHNTIAGALALREVALFPVVVGQEVSAADGELVGLFLQEEVPRDLSARDTVRLIKEQGGLAGVPHPFDRFRRERLDKRTLGEIAVELDFIEGLNARVTLAEDNRRAQEFARSWGLPCTAGSDAHSRYELGRAYVEMAPFADRTEFLERLSEGHVCGGVSPFWVHFFSIVARARRKLRRG